MKHVIDTAYQCHGGVMVVRTGDIGKVLVVRPLSFLLAKVTT